MRGVLAAALVVCALGPGGAAWGQEAPAKQDVAKRIESPGTPVGKMLGRVLEMFAGKPEAIGEQDLAESFRAAVPIAKLRAVAAQIRAAEGDLQLESIEEGATERALVAGVTGTKKGTALKIRLALDGDGKIVGLLVQPGLDRRVPELKTWDELDAIVREHWPAGAVMIARLEARDSMVLSEHPQPGDGDMQRRDDIHVVHALNEKAPLALGSAFKLWVLGALAEAVDRKEARWDEELKIEPRWKSLPSGVTQDEPSGKPFTLRHYAEKMISISDNTATDHLIHRLGRERCERFMASVCGDADRNRPFLTTRDLFVLKLTPGNELPDKYVRATIAARRAMLGDDGEIAKGAPQPILAAAWKAPRYIDSLEWFASSFDEARTLAALDALSRTPGLEPIREILSINPGVPIDRKLWAYAGFKGGSEPGVMSLSWLLERKDGRRFVVSLIVNDTKKAIDEPLTIGVAQRALEFLGKWERDGADGGDAPKP